MVRIMDPAGPSDYREDEAMLGNGDSGVGYFDRGVAIKPDDGHLHDETDINMMADFDRDGVDVEDDELDDVGFEDEFDDDLDVADDFDDD